MLEFQEQNCQLTLEEGLKIYYDAFEDQESILKGDTLPEFIFGHDCTHVIFSSVHSFCGLGHRQPDDRVDLAEICGNLVSKIDFVRSRPISGPPIIFTKIHVFKTWV